jgi:hypothetical protein
MSFYKDDIVPSFYDLLIFCWRRYNPGTLQHHKWENAMTLDRRSWGNRRDMSLGRREDPLLNPNVGQTFLNFLNSRLRILKKRKILAQSFPLSRKIPAQ